LHLREERRCLFFLRNLLGLYVSAEAKLLLANATTDDILKSNEGSSHDEENVARINL
jgi:hypothetical protein